MSYEETARKLVLRLDADLSKLNTYDHYFEGRVPLQFLAPEIKEATKGRLQALTLPWPRVVVQAVKERLEISGFRVADNADAGLWQIWKRCNMDQFSMDAHEDALIHGRSFVFVWADEDGKARITVESAKECWVQNKPGTRIRQYAIRRWVDGDTPRLDLFTPNRVVRFKSAPIVEDVGSVIGLASWDYSDSIENPLGVVPIIPILHRPRTLAPYGTSELADLLPLFDSLAKIFTDLMIGSEFTSLPRRWATGLQLPEKRDENGQPMGKVDPAEAFDPIAGRMWFSESPDTQFGEFGGSSLAGYTSAITTLTEALAAAACLPSHYLGISTSIPASADAIRSGEAALVAKVRERQRSYEPAWEEAIRLAAAVETGSFDPRLDGVEVTWKSPETRTLAQDADAVLKLVAAGILPQDAALELLGYSPAQISRIREMRVSVAPEGESA